MLRTLHVAAFALAASGCLAALWRVRRVPHDGIRRGLAGLVGASGVWATAELVTFLPLPRPAVVVVYQVGLVAGLTTVGAWLYFCSAYTGHDYHLNPLYRRIAAAVFVCVSTLKLTNGLHGWYFELEVVTTPFRHANIDLLGLHWLTTTVAYSLTAVGTYMLFRTFVRSNIDTTALTVLVGLTVVPVVPNVMAAFSVPGLLANNYEPAGVAVFALGALYVVDGTFERVTWTSHRQLLNSINDAVIVVDGNDVVREFNDAATTLFPGVDAGSSLSAAAPELAAHAGATADDTADSRFCSVDRGTGTRHYLVTETAMTIGPERTGRALVATDATEAERQRRAARRQSDQLEGFSTAVAHELRNTLSIADGSVDLAAEAVAAGDEEAAAEHLERTDAVTDRMIGVAETLMQMARLSQRVTDPATLRFEPTVREAVRTADDHDVRLAVEGDGRVRACSERWSELVGCAARLAEELDAAELAATLSGDEVRFRVVGGQLDCADPSTLFDYGAVPHAEAGLVGPNIRALAQAHGWEVEATDRDAGIEIRVSGVTTEPTADADGRGATGDD
ncbi:hypothetical protein BRD02_05590 [Halobacteriales archaeon QS_8_69_73]|nr:MAG: hypothetical protein BRD02_05590 [Halobacteriales archaeon QS_8_69_73]